MDIPTLYLNRTNQIKIKNFINEYKEMLDIVYEKHFKKFDLQKLDFYIFAYNSS